MGNCCNIKTLWDVRVSCINYIEKNPNPITETNYYKKYKNKLNHILRIAETCTIKSS